MPELVPATLITTYLEMTSATAFLPAFLEDSSCRIEKMDVADTEFYLFMYRAVGYKLRWRDRIIMPTEQLKAILESASTHVFILYVGAAPAGYVELHQNSDSIEIAFFGLREAYHGRGLGGHLLSFGIQKAWDLGAKRVWVHTCNMDGEAALPNYQKRGFRIYDVTEEEMPERYKA